MISLTGETEFFKIRNWPRYDTIEALNVHWKGDCDQLNPAHIASNKEITRD